jgi:hypothetical protein
MEMPVNPLQLREDEIGRKLDEAQRSGELRAAQSYGKPLLGDAGWEQTPEEFRMGFKILKNAGVVPPEVELFHQRAQLRAALEAASTEPDRLALQKELSELEQRISLRLEALRSSGSL